MWAETLAKLEKEIVFYHGKILSSSCQNGVNDLDRRLEEIDSTSQKQQLQFLGTLQEFRNHVKVVMTPPTLPPLPPRLLSPLPQLQRPLTATTLSMEMRGSNPI